MNVYIFVEYNLYELFQELMLVKSNFLDSKYAEFMRFHVLDEISSVHQFAT